MTQTSTVLTANTQAEFDAQTEALASAAALYYDGSVLAMTDAEYDARLDALAAVAAAHPEWVTDASRALLDQVAAGQSAGGDVTHPEPMLSMAKVPADDTTEALAALIAACPGGVVVEPKMDGLALRVVYRAGRLVQAATRGDGLSGEDVTAQVTRGAGITGLPRTLEAPWTGEVRGEVYMTAEQFEAAQALRAERGGKPFVNPRNATAGALRKSGDEHWMPMSFAAYDLSNPDADPYIGFTHATRMGAAEDLGFATARQAVPTLDSAFIITGLADVRHQIEVIESARPTLGFDIDGAVIKADHDEDRAALGAGSRTPKWALAYKYAAEEATSVILDIETNIGRTGRLSLRARIEPTFVGGTVITYATLHHPGFVAEQGLNVGSKVVVKRAGDVIPRVTAALDTEPNPVPWTPPVGCPQCGGEWDTSSLLWRCHSPECSVAGRLAYFASRDCMDIEGLGDTVAEALAETVLPGGRQVKDVADLYDLTEDEWAGLILGTTTTGGVRTLGTANARKIMLSLLDSKHQPFNRVITALGIRMTGRSVGRWLAREFPTMDRLLDATVEEVASIEKLGQVKATHIVEGLAAMRPVIDRLAAAGVNMGSEPEATSAAALPLAGQTFVVSGAVPGYTRTTIAEAIEAAGGKASSSVSKTTTALVTAETETSKAQKAAALGIPVIDPAAFVAMLNGTA